MNRHAIGIDFGTESTRVLIVDVTNGRIAAQSVASYFHGVIDHALPASGALLPPHYALQHPRDWLDAAAQACRQAMREAAIPPQSVIGVGVDFTSCTMLPVFADGTPLCLSDRFRNIPSAWPKLWKHHSAAAEADHLNAIAKQRNEPWLPRYGGTVSLEWFFPKVLETLHAAPDVYHAADLWLEAGDWFVWQLTSGPFPRCLQTSLVRSTCQAGYKALWNNQTGYPSKEFFAALHPAMADVVSAKMPGSLRAPGTLAGHLSPASAALFGLPAGIPVSTAIIDAHAGVIGAGAADPGTMVLVLGTSACHMVNSLYEHPVPGVAGIVRDGIFPGYFGYETGQAAVGDALEWVSRTFNQTHAELTEKATFLPPGSGGLLAIDWLNGCRTPLMDPRLTGAILGLTLATRPEQIYRAMIEATGFGLRLIVEALRNAGVPITRFIAAGGLPYKSPLLMQIYADVLGEEIPLAPTEQSVALGAAILGVLAAGPAATGHQSFRDAIRAMAPPRPNPLHRPDPAHHQEYLALFASYRNLTDTNGELAKTMRQLTRQRTSNVQNG